MITSQLEVVNGNVHECTNVALPTTPVFAQTHCRKVALNTLQPHFSVAMRSDSRIQNNGWRSASIHGVQQNGHPSWKGVLGHLCSAATVTTAPGVQT